MFTAAVLSLDGAKHNTNTKSNPNLIVILILTLTLTLFLNPICGTHKDERTVLYRTKSIDGNKPDTNPDPNTNPIQLFYAFFEHRPLIFSLALFANPNRKIITSLTKV